MARMYTAKMHITALLKGLLLKDILLKGKLLKSDIAKNKLLPKTFCLTFLLKPFSVCDLLKSIVLKTILLAKKSIAKK